MGYRFIKSLTSDVSWEATGKDLKEVFEQSAAALFSVICRIDKISPEKKITVEISGENPGDLMINWLQELIALVDIEEMFFSGFNITEISDTMLKAEVSGESTSPGKGETVVKAVTYHDFEFKKTDEGYYTRIVVDI